LNVDANYGFFKIKSDQMQRNYYFDPAGNPTEQRIYQFVAPTDIDIYSLKVDYDNRVKNGTVSVGGKVSYVKAGNVFSRYDVANGGKNFDSTRSNSFNYKENINALYVNYNTTMKGGVVVQFGVRMENTNLEGISDGFAHNGTNFEPSKSGFKRNYTDFFPSAAITFAKNPMSQLGFRYSRRIDRPAYQDLNPFEFKLDEYTFQKGNIDLRPQYTHSFAITHMYKYKLNTTLNYSHVDDVSTQFIDTAEESKSFITRKNLATQDIVSLNVGYPFMYKSYSAYTNVNANYSKYKADFGTGREVNLDAFSVTFFQQHSLKFAKVYTAELSGWYNSPGIWGGTFKSSALWSMDAGLMKTIFKGNGNIKIAVSDVFQTLRWKGVNEFAGQYLRVRGGPESRQFKVNLTYRFGSNQIKASRQRNTGLEDESKRVGNQGGGISNQ
jgi:iron complex outermembrane recepter protein